MIFTDRQSLIICAVVILGFSISGIIGILDNYVIILVLLVLFVLVVINLFLNKQLYEKESDMIEKTDENKSSFTQDNN
ncbi:hypothetical protein [Xanthomarina sp. F2636L]|uniref:hypothetical protein n=1 Tax=Xanthomarina sp. F2636L TaxID=2996018 RepID=UPI00225E46E4|nr:hypothetical protein [Xanthomarina sp. F2636L]MCX7550205.1 hypothetical protein [Xanthomarina sp. F2636L]